VPHAGPDELLGAYDDQLRRWRPDRLPAGETAEEDGPLLRFSGGPGGGWVLYRDLDGVEGAALDELILRQVRFFEERGDRFEWKYHGYDLPADLPERLRAAGFVPEATETTAMETRVWGERNSWLPDMLESERSVDPDALTVVAAEAGDTVVCAAWIRYPSGTEFGTLWGGATLPEWRRQGIYRATVAYRANLARQRSFRYLETDASDDSRPILERLGFVPVTTTTPYIWSPPK